jgi:Zn-dependent protease
MTPDVLAQRFILFIPVILSLTVHEWAHARTALLLGDDTALRQGRVTLNPLAHLDPIGTLLLPMLGIPFGWAKPVPIEPTRFRSEVTMSHGVLLTAAAGPLSNLLLAFVCRAVLTISHDAGASLGSGMEFFLERSIAINFALAIFNLLPIPPLDGSRIVDGLIPFGWRGLWDRISKIGVFVLIALFVVPQLIFAGNLAEWLSRFFGGLFQR